MRFSRTQQNGDGFSIRAYWAPLLVLTIALAATLITAWYFRAAARAKDEARFETAVQQTVDGIEQRLEVYINALRATAAFFAVQEEITRTEFQQYAQKLQLRRSYPGIQGFGLAVRVPHEEKQTFLHVMEQQFPEGFEIRPSGERDVYVPVTFLQPQDARNVAAHGFDMFSEEHRRQAIIAAGELRGPAVTKRVTLAQEITDEKQPGFLIYTPIFRGDGIPSGNEGQERLVGYAYAPLRAGDFFLGIFSRTGSPVIHFEVYDGDAASPETLLYSSVRPATKRPQFSTEMTLEIPNHEWMIRLQSTAAFEAASTRLLPVWFLVGGLIFSFALFGIALALTRARRRAEQSSREARAQREEYRVTLASIADAVIATDSGARITFMNSMAESLTKWTLPEAQGRPLEEVFRTLDESSGNPQPSPAIQVLKENLNSRLTDSSLLVDRDRNHLPIESSAARMRDLRGEPSGVVLVFRDVSAKRAEELGRRRAEEKLRDAQARLKSGIQAASVGTWIWDFENNRIYADEFLRETFAIPPERGDGLPAEVYLTKIHPDDVGRVKEHFTFTNVLNTPLRETEYRIVDEKGSERWFAARGRIVNTRGSSPRLVGAIIDVTDRKRAETQLAAAKAELEKHAKNLEETVAERTAQLRQSIEELEAYSYSLSHDLRAPLRAIKGFSQILADEYSRGIGSDGSTFLQKIIHAAERMERLIQDVLAFSRISRREITVENVNVDRLLHGIVQEQPEFQLPKADVEIESPLHPIRGHEASLTQCVTNLLENAVKFVAPGVQPKVRIWSEVRGDYVRLWIADNGIGMEKEAQEKLFEMFQRIHSGNYPGTGLGLAIVRKAVERMNGTVGVESTPGKGSKFWLELPRANEE